MATVRDNTNNEEFVTIVSVGNSFAENGVCEKMNNPQKSASGDVPFVTVLSIGQTVIEEEVTVYRLPGEKLGFGLKFEGGTKSAERVRRLFIQSCAAESPAGRARAQWGPLDAGDEILCIDGISVTSLTRLECVRCLKDSNVAVKLLVRHSPEGKHLVLDGNCPIKNGIDSDHTSAELERLSLPPPVPPRKLPRRNTKESINCENLNGNGRVVSSFEVNQSVIECKRNDGQFKIDTSAILENGQARKGPLGRQSPGRPRRPAPIHSAPPPEAQVYTDLFCHEKENGIHIAESESDDTGSSISTVIDRLSSYSSFPGSVENSIPSTPTLGTKQINIHVLTSIENMDEKFISDIPTRFIDDITNKDSSKSNIKMPSDKNPMNDVQISNGEVHTNSNEVVIPSISITKEFTSVKLDHSAKYNNDANNNTNTIKIGNEDVVDFAPSKVTAVTEIPKPLPRNLNKKNVDNHHHSDYGNKMDRPYEENLSPAKLHNIETWLQDAINMNNFESAKDHHEYDRETMKPEALPRLIDFVPKSQFGSKNQVEVINQREPPVATERKEKPEYNLKLTINIDKEHEILKADDLSSDWTYTGGSSPQLETIGEDDEDSPGGPTLPIIKVTQQPSTGLTNGDGCSNSEAAKSTSSDDTIFNDPPPISSKYEKPAQEKASSKTIEPEECAVNLVVSRGTRSPPDGRENPATHQENVPIFSNITNKLQDYASQKSSCPPITKSSTNYLLKETMVESSPRILYEPSQKNNKIMPSKTYGRGKDVKSEGSVKDKIAMFSVHKTTPDTGSDKKSPVICKSTEPRMSQRFLAYNDSLSKSHESLLDSSNYYSGKSAKLQKSNADWSVNGAPNKIQETVNGVSNKNQDFVLAKPYNNTSYEIKSLSSVEKPKEAKTAPITTRIVQPISAIDSKRIDKAKTDSHKSTIDYLIEQRRKSMTKLRGLVIPDSPCISDLPEIKSRDSLKALTSPSPAIDKTSTLDRFSSRSKSSTTSPFLPSLWDSQSLANNVPKYSPAFKRKPLQVYGTKATNEPTLTKPMNGFNGENKGEAFSASAAEKSTIPSKPPRTTLDARRPYEQHDFGKKTSTLPSNFRGPASVANPSNYGSAPSQLAKPKRHDLFSVIDTVDHSNLKIMKAFSDTADSDNDSAVSSTQSSYLSTVSSPTPSLNTADNSESDCSSQSTLSRDVVAASKLAMGKIVNGHDDRPFENGLNRSYLQMDDRKRNVCRSLSSDTSTSVGSSNSSTLTSGSQASCSSAGSSNPDTGSHRILKPRSIEAINRKNILASAKCRSGKDNKFGSPLIERKFSDAESTDDCGVNKDPKHMSNGGSMVRYHSIKNASAYTGDGVLKVAYSTLVVEDKCPSLKKQGVDCTCSTTDTGSESDAEVAIPVKVETKPGKPKKYSNGSAPVQQERTTPSENYTEQSRIRKRVVATVTKPSPVVEVGTRATADGVESPKTTTTTAKVKGNVVQQQQHQHQQQQEDDEQCFEVRLSRGEGGGVGVTLAGGADCEAKEVTIHKVLQGSAAERDGRLCKGDKVVSINGQSMKGLTHAQSVAILKDPQPEVIVVIRGKRPAADVSKPSSNNVSMRGDSTISVELEKADAPGGAGLGISLEGGGNKPLLINKLFTGGAAARSGQITSGSELLAAGGTKLVGMTRTEAWGLLRALPPGPVTLLLRPP